jgi:hypothetical protein
MAMDDPRLAPTDLAGWYAKPMGRSEAQALHDWASSEMRSAMRTGRDTFSGGVHILIARYWLDRPTELDYRSLRASAKGRRQQALVELVYGQLLISRKRQGALTHLGRGFDLAAALVTTRDYIRLLRRHAALEHLGLSPRAAEPADLDDLLKEAAVIEQIESANPTPRQAPPDKTDTVG